MGIGGGYAQQGGSFSYNQLLYFVIQHLSFIVDAEECYSQVLNSVRDVEVPDILIRPGAVNSGQRKRFVEQYMMGEMRRE